MGNVYAGVKNAVVGPYPNIKGAFGTKKFTMKHYSVLPIICLMVMDIMFATSTVIYMYNTRDITIDRSKKPINERMDLLKPYLLKMFVINEVLRPGVELHEAYKAMDEEDKRSMEEN